MGWLILGVYVIGFLFTARKVALHLIEEDAVSELRHREEMRRYREQPQYDGKPLVDGADRVMNLFMGCMAAAAWPVVLAVWAVARSLRSPSERIETDQQELRALRKLAREHNLPMPGEDS